MKKLVLCFLILSSVLFLNSCSGIPVKYKSQENKAVVLFDVEFGATPIFSERSDYYDKVTEGGTLDGVRTYRNTAVFQNEGSDQLFDATVGKDLINNFKKFNTDVLDKALVSSFEKIADLTKEKINKKYSWLKVTEASTVSEARAKGGKETRGTDIASIIRYNPTVIKDTINNPARDDFFSGAIGKEQDLAIKVKITEWFIYSKSLIPIYLGGIPTGGDNYQRMAIKIVVYDKKNKSVIYNQSKTSDILMSKKTLLKIGEESSSEEIENWSQKTLDQISNSLDFLITSMDK